MGKSNRQKTKKTSRFSIRAKLLTIIAIIVILSVAVSTGVVLWLVNQDLNATAEVNNEEANRRSAMEAQYTIENVSANSRMLLQIIDSAGAGNALSRQAIESFFEQNKQVAALVTAIPGQPNQELTNNQFFLEREIRVTPLKHYLEAHRKTLERAAAGETMLLNATPEFIIPMLALFFPWQGKARMVLFSSEKLTESLSSRINQSFMINRAGDILIHPDPDIVKAGTNVAHWNFIKKIREHPAQSMQELTEADFNFTPIGTNTIEPIVIRSTDENANIIVQKFFLLAQQFLDLIAHIPDTAQSTEIRYYVAFTKLDIGASTVITGIEHNKVFEMIGATTRRNLYFTGAVLLLAGMFIWFFSKSISIPIKILAAAALTIEKGSFEVKLKSKSRDEIGFLTKSFQRMSTALGIFGRFTNREIAVRAMRGEIKPGGLPKHATIFFSDIRGFTEKSENFTKTFGDEASDRIVQWLNEYFTLMVDIVEKTGGVVDKFIGDAVMAHWGTAYTAGSPQKDAYNCVRAALMMRLALINLNKDRGPDKPPISIGCGINTGIVTAGQIGSDLRMEYTVIGDPVNLASRAEALNKPLGTDILITEDTWALIKDHIIVEEMPPVEVKGKEKPVRLFAVVNITAVTDKPRTLSEVRRLLGIKAPDMAKVNINSEEKKYKIGGSP
ncbi:MAG: HAMP domain-containing protein [Treponema sp.]|nr:HAMP domain-containing protein [Treponema sp.]